MRRATGRARCDEHVTGTVDPTWPIGVVQKSIPALLVSGQ